MGHGNLYFTIAGARGAVSATAPLSYSVGTGAFSIGLSAGAPMSYDSGTGAFTLAKATTSTDGYLSASDWNTFNGKVGLGSFSALAPMSYDGGTGAFSMSMATTSTNGYLMSSDWNTFFNKEPAISNPADTSKYYRGDKSWQTLNTAAIAELTNLYYTDTRARLALSAAAPISYNNSTGAFSIAAASTSSNGYLTSTDWNTFKNGTSQWTMSSTTINYTTGNVGIGSTAPVSPLNVMVTSGAAASLSSDSAYFALNSDGASQQLAMGIDNWPYDAWIQVKRATNDDTSFPLALQPVGGNVGIGSTNPVSPSKLAPIAVTPSWQYQIVVPEQMPRLAPTIMLMGRSWPGWAHG